MDPAVWARMNERLDRIERLVTALETGLRDLTSRAVDRTVALMLVLGLGAWLTMLIGLQTWLSRR
jgi:tetrahydromethanopterin S-methyltransferase subunit G